MKWIWSKKKEEDKPKSRERNTSMNKVYTDRFGNQWYEYTNPMQISAKRAIAAEVATRFADFNLTKENLLVLMEQMKKKANEGNIVELFQLLAEIEYRLQYVGEEETLRELACCYYVINDEDETDFTDKYRDIKLKVFKEDGAARDFFIQGAFQHTIRYSSMSEVDILDYLKANAPSEERLNQILRELKLEGTLMKSTT